MSRGREGLWVVTMLNLTKRINEVWNCCSLYVVSDIVKKTNNKKPMAVFFMFVVFI